MGQLIVEQIVTVDGFAAEENGELEFFELTGDDSDEQQVEQLAMLESVDAIVLGANTYRIFQEYWPTADTEAEPVAEFINTRPRHVITSTITDGSWGEHVPSIIEKGDAVASVRDLKSRYDGNIIVWGSLTLTEALFAADLVDVVRLRIVPVLIGRGLPSARGANARLALESQVTFANGNVLLEYSVRHT